jgi:hypothetical protein
VNVSRVFFAQNPGIVQEWKEGEKVDNGKSTPERVAVRVAEAVSQESCQEWHLEHRSPQALVRFQERITPDSKEEGHSPD